MKRVLFFKHVLFFVLIFFPAFHYAQLFTQDFSSSSSVSDYVNSTAPTNGQFNSVGTSGLGTVISINAGQLRIVRTSQAGSYSRTNNFSPTPTSLIYKFDITVSGNSGARTTAATWQVGSEYGTANSEEENRKTHSKIALNISALPGQFGMRIINSDINSLFFSGKQTVTWYINNSGTSLSYEAPDASNQTVGDDTLDLWIGTTKVFDDIAVTTPTVNLTDLKFVFSGGNATIDLDNIVIDSFSTNVPTLATGGITSLSGFNCNEGTGPSASQFVTLSASNLNPINGNVTVTPAANYEISSDNITFTSSELTVSYVAGSIPQTPVTKIYVRLKAGLSANNYNAENIIIAGGTASSVSVTCNGVVNKSDINLAGLSNTAMNYILGSGPSVSVNSKVSGTFLNENVTIVPNDNTLWEVSTENSNWANTAVFIPASGVLLANSNRIYIRLKAGLGAGTYSGNIIASSAFADSEMLNFTGEVLQPLIQLNLDTQTVNLTGFTYDFAQGPSAIQSVKVDGSNLNEDLTSNCFSELGNFNKYDLWRSKSAAVFHGCF